LKKRKEYTLSKVTCAWTMLRRWVIATAFAVNIIKKLFYYASERKILSAVVQIVYNATDLLTERK